MMCYFSQIGRDVVNSCKFLVKQVEILLIPVKISVKLVELLIPVKNTGIKSFTNNHKYLQNLQNLQNIYNPT